MAHIHKNCWTDLVHWFTMSFTYRRGVAFVSPDEPPRAGFEGPSPRSPFPEEAGHPPRPASSRFRPGRRHRARATVRRMAKSDKRTHQVAGTDGSAAFFDLDRTLLSGASGPAISAALRTVGL